MPHFQNFGSQSFNFSRKLQTFVYFPTNKHLDSIDAFLIQLTGHELVNFKNTNLSWERQSLIGV